MVSSATPCETGKANKYGKITPFMRAFGKMTRSTEGEDSSVPIATSMKAIGKMENTQAKEFSTMLMGPRIQVSGLPTSNTDMESKKHQTGQSTKDSSSRGKNTGPVK